MEDEKEVVAMTAEAESVRAEAGGEGKRKKTLGRRKIEIKRIESLAARYVCFSKRHDGLFKKAVELTALCGAHVAVVVFSSAGKPYSLGYPSVNAVVDRYLDPASAPAPCAAAADKVARLALILREYESEKERLEKAIKAEVSRRKALDAAVRAADDYVRRAGMPELLAMLAALERVRVQAEAARRMHEAIVEEVMMQQCAAAGASDDAFQFQYPSGGEFVSDGSAGSSSHPGAMDAQMTMLMGGDGNHAPMHFASMMLPPYLPPPPFNYGSDHNQFEGYGGYDLGDSSSGHDAANELEAYYATTTTCNFFV